MSVAVTKWESVIILIRRTDFVRWDLGQNWRGIESIALPFLAVLSWIRSDVRSVCGESLYSGWKISVRNCLTSKWNHEEDDDDNNTNWLSSLSFQVRAILHCNQTFCNLTPRWYTGSGSGKNAHKLATNFLNTILIIFTALNMSSPLIFHWNKRKISSLEHQPNIISICNILNH